MSSFEENYFFAKILLSHVCHEKFLMSAFFADILKSRTNTALL